MKFVKFLFLFLIACLILWIDLPENQSFFIPFGKKKFEIKVTDMDKDSINTVKYGIRIESPQKTGEHLDWCDIAVVTGSTIVNDTMQDFLIKKPVIFYGVTISGAARVLGLDNFCHCAK